MYEQSGNFKLLHLKMVVPAQTNNVTLLKDERNAQWAHNLLELYGLGENKYKL